MRIVLVEDNESLRKGITYRLNDDGHSVDALGDGEEADAFLSRESADLVILDITLPGQSGLDVLRKMRQRGDPSPVILLTARSSTEDRVTGLDAGADDYLSKPFAMDELAARVRALSRRGGAPRKDLIVLGVLELDPAALHLTHRGSSVEVPKRELTLLAALARAEGRPVSKESLLDQVYGTGSETDEKVIEVYVSRLRRRLAEFGIRIPVARGIGYSLSVDET
ncbi:MAG: response regulator transcription factor [Pseudomonadota bacterium]